jgi:hypothetical protein
MRPKYHAEAACSHTRLYWGFRLFLVASEVVTEVFFSYASGVVIEIFVGLQLIHFFSRMWGCNCYSSHL